MEGGEVVFSIKVWCLVLGRTCLELAWQHRSSSFRRTLEREMEGGEVVFSIKVWCLVLGRTCLELAGSTEAAVLVKTLEREMARR